MYRVRYGYCSCRWRIAHRRHPLPQKPILGASLFHGAPAPNQVQATKEEYATPASRRRPTEAVGTTCGYLGSLPSGQRCRLRGALHRRCLRSTESLRRLGCSHKRTLALFVNNPSLLGLLAPR